MLRLVEMMYLKAVKHEKRHILIIFPLFNCSLKKMICNDTSYIIQTVFAYQHSKSTKGLPGYTGSYNHDKDQPVL